MVGIRSTLFGLLLALPVALVAPVQRDTLSLDMVATDAGLLVMRHEVDIALWQRCVNEGGCSHVPAPGPGATGNNFPVTGIGILDAEEFVHWAQKNISPGLRLPNLEEWYAFSGVPPARPNKIFADPRLAWAATYGADGKVDPTLRPAGGFGATPSGLGDVRGNVWEWTSTCVVAAGANHCPAYFAAGLHEAKVPVFVRDPTAGGCATGTPPAHLGLRLVMDAQKWNAHP